MTQDEFYRAFESLARMALTAGLMGIDRPHVHPANYSAQERRRFVSACHRGYDKAQQYMVKLLRDIAESTEMNDKEKRRCAFIVRGVAETIALLLLGDKAYMIRRLSLFDVPVDPSFDVLRAALSAAEKLNSQSRLTFALLTDLTVSIQVADILRVDFRQSNQRYEFIELKSGKVNAELEKQLENYPATLEGLKQVDIDPAIEAGHRDQAKRILRQRSRLRQINEIAKTDAGVDIRYDRPVQVTSKAIVLKEYDEVVDELIRRAEAGGSVTTVIADMIALSATVGPVSSSESQSRHALGHAIENLSLMLRDSTPDISQEVASALGKTPPYVVFNLFETVLGRVAIRPPTSWAISADRVNALVRRRAVVMSGFHLVGFIKLAREVGVDIRFASRRETAEFRKAMGHLEIPAWNARALVRGPGNNLGPVTGGLLTRFLYNLTEPRSFLSQMLEIEREMLAEGSESEVVVCRPSAVIDDG